MIGSSENTLLAQDQEAGLPNRESLQVMTSNDLNVQANTGGSPMKRINIPRPGTTPTKDTSALTSQGFISPKGAEGNIRRALSPTASTQQLNNSKSAFNVGFRKHELKLLQKEISEKESELSDLKNSILTLRTKVQELEINNQELKDRYSTLSKEQRMKQNELSRIIADKEHMYHDLKRRQELKLQNLEYEFRQSAESLNKTYTYEAERILKSKTEVLNNEKSKLQHQLNSINNDIENHEAKYTRFLNELQSSHKSELNKIQSLMVDSRNSYDDELKVLVKQAGELQRTIADTRKNLELNEQLKIEKIQELKSIKDRNLNKSNDVTELLTKLSNLKDSISSKRRKINQLQDQMNWQNQQILESTHHLSQEEEIRRKLHNRLQELKGNIRVFCRVRPPLDSEVGDDTIGIKVPDNDEEDQEIDIIDPKTESPFLTSSFNPTSSSISKKSTFKFDKIFQMDSTNSEIFDEISQLVQTAIYGYNVCIFAYGQTGSGKTFTMSNSDGMIPRAIDQIFETCAKLNQNNNWTHKIYGEFIEIYNENINDLLNDVNSNDTKQNKYEIRHDLTNETTSITDLNKIELTSPKMVKDILKRVYLNRSIASTKSNERSSRSHSIYIIRIEGKNHKTGELTSGVLNLIDLAGSERLTNSQVVGDRLKETQSINKSLSCLGDVIYALGDGNNGRHIPFRNSKLTYLLQFSLLGESKTLMFVNVSPLVKNYNETINSLRFATKVNNTKIKK
jgi:kinesin family protein C1